LNFKVCRNNQNSRAFGKIKQAWARSARIGPNRPDPAQERFAQRGSRAFEPASGAGLSAAAEYRNGIGRFRPFDQDADQRRWAVFSFASRVSQTLTLATGFDEAELT
jgi:hypothetical protein